MTIFGSSSGLKQLEHAHSAFYFYLLNDLKKYFEVLNTILQLASKTVHLSERLLLQLLTAHHSIDFSLTMSVLKFPSTRNHVFNLCSPNPSCLNLPGLAGTCGRVGISLLSYMFLHFYELQFNLIEVMRLKKRNCSAL